MDTITIRDLEVYFCVGVSDEERAKPQRLLITVEMDHNFTASASTDDLGDTIDYFEVSQRILAFGVDAHWKLIETLALDLSAMILDEFQPKRVVVQVKKFIIPQAAYVAVRAERFLPA